LAQAIFAQEKKVQALQFSLSPHLHCCTKFHSWRDEHFLVDHMEVKAELIWLQAVQEAEVWSLQAAEEEEKEEELTV